jgi:hypothetical protein
MDDLDQTRPQTEVIMEAAKSTPPPSAVQQTEAVVTLATEEFAWAQARAVREGKTMSAVVSEALRRQRQSEAVRRYLAEFPDDVTEADLVAVEVEWR